MEKLIKLSLQGHQVRRYLLAECKTGVTQYRVIQLFASGEVQPVVSLIRYNKDKKTWEFFNNFIAGTDEPEMKGKVDEIWAEFHRLEKLSVHKEDKKESQ
jgi:hypothetical protein